MKKVLAIMLVCFMLVSLLPMGAFAEEIEQETPACKGTNHYLSNCEDYDLVEEVPGKCGGYAYNVYVCNICGDYFADDFVKIDGTHNFELTVAPKHSKDGEQVCTICGHKEAVKCDGKPGDLVGNCKDGWTAKCDKCGEVLESKPGAHTWSEKPEIITEPNEATGEPGLAKYTCTVCGAEKEVIILTHVCEEYMVNVDAKAPTCTEDGYTAHQKCTFCNETFGKEVLPAHGHGEPEAMIVEGTQNVSSYGQYYLPAELTGLVTFSLTNATTGSWYYVNVQTTYDDGWTWETLAKLYNGDSAEVELVAGQQYRMYSFTSGTVTYSSSMMEQITLGDCTTDGTRVWQCSLCHEKITENLGKNHSDFVVLHEVEATCTTFGYKVVTCIDCGHYEVEQFPKLGHTERPEDAYSVRPGCTEDGYYYWWCERCDEEIHETIPATGCPAETLIFEATCGQYGYSITYCTNGSWCDLYNWSTNPMVSEITGKLPNGQEVTIELDGQYMLISFEILSDKNPNKHNPGTEHEPQVIDPSCTEDGLIIYWCVDCNEGIVETLPALGHEWAEELEVVAPTCYKPGYIAQVCSVCGELNLETIEFVEFTNEYIYSYADAILAHDIEGVIPDVYREGNCEVVGLDRYLCNECGEYILVKDETTGFHVMPEGLLERDDPNNQVEIPVFEGTVYSGSVDAAGAYDGHYYTFVMPCDGKVTIVKDGNYYVSGINDYSTYRAGQEINVNIWAYDAFEYTVIITPYVEGVRNQQFCGKDATCTEDGYTAQWYCTVCDKFFESTEIKANGHNKVVDVKAFAPDCINAGATEGWHCDICGYIEESVEIPALGHIYELKDSAEFVDGKQFGYEHWECTREGCTEIVIGQEGGTEGHEFIKNYVSVCLHEKNSRFDRDLSFNATCTADGQRVYTCKHCDAIMEIEVLPRLHHTNVAGQDLEFCGTVTEDITCATCEGKFAIPEHTFGDVIVYEPNCMGDGYIMNICTVCDHYEVTNIEISEEEREKLHVWSDWAPVKDDNGVIIGEKRACKVCSKIEHRDVTCIAFSATIENAANAAGSITDGSLVKVTIDLSGMEDFAWGFKFNVGYTSNMSFVKANFITDNFNYAQIANDNDGFITVIANANGDVEINGTEGIVELYFKVTAPTISNIAINIYDVEALNADAKPVDYVAYGAEAETVLLMDLDLDGDITLVDALAAYNLIEAAEYDAAADLDKDGELTLVDFLALYDYLSGAKDYEDIVALG